MASSQHPDGQSTASDTEVTGESTTPDNVTDIAQARRRVKKSASTAGKKPTGAKGSTKSTSNRRFDHEKVASIKAAIANGTYTIDAQRIADKFIEKESP